MGLFAKKDPLETYQNNKTAYLNKASVQKKTDDAHLHSYKNVQMGQVVRMYVKVTSGKVQVGDLLEVEYARGNKLGIMDAVAPIGAIYQILSPGGLGKKEELLQTTEAYENDEVWIELPGLDASLIEKNGMIRKSKAKNAAVGTNGAANAANSTVSNVAPNTAGSTANSGAAGGAMSVSYDEEVSRMVNYFKNELYGYFAARGGIGHITQDLGYSLMAQKKRLDRMGITMAIEKSTDIGAAALKMEVKRYSSSQYDVAEADEAVKLKRTYHMGGRIVYQDEDWRLCHYLLAGAKYNQTGLIACPSCGNYAPREELLTGCPYCNTQFQIKDLSLRVAGYSQKQIEQSRNGKIDLGYALYRESNQKEYDQVLRHRMEEIDPLFSPTAFYNSMRNKLYSIVFAENVPALRNLADEDFNIAPFYDRFKNVIDIDIQGIDTKEFKKNSAYILVDVVMNTMVLRYREDLGYAVWTREKITMSFVKHIKNKTGNIFEPGKIYCRSCGGSYSLYEGKACSFCGHEIDYLMYDWLLVDLADEFVRPA